MKLEISTLRILLNQVPDDAEAYAYDGETRGLIIIHGSKQWEIGASEYDWEEPYNDGFDKERLIKDMDAFLDGKDMAKEVRLIREERARVRGMIQGATITILCLIAIGFVALSMVPDSACDAIWGMFCG